MVLATPAIPPHKNYVMFDLEGMPPQLDELDKIYLWGAQVFGENPSEFKVAVSGFGVNGDRESWTGFLDNAKQIFEAYGDIPWVHWAPYEELICVDMRGVLAISEASLPVWREIFWTC